MFKVLAATAFKELSGIFSIVIILMLLLYLNLMFLELRLIWFVFGLVSRIMSGLKLLVTMVESGFSGILCLLLFRLFFLTNTSSNLECLKGLMSHFDVTMFHHVPDISVSSLDTLSSDASSLDALSPDTVHVPDIGVLSLDTLSPNASLPDAVPLDASSLDASSPDAMALDPPSPGVPMDAATLKASHDDVVLPPRAITRARARDLQAKLKMGLLSHVAPMTRDDDIWVTLVTRPPVSSNP